MRFFSAQAGRLRSPALGSALRIGLVGALLLGFGGCANFTAVGKGGKALMEHHYQAEAGKVVRAMRTRPARPPATPPKPPVAPAPAASKPVKVEVAADTKEIVAVFSIEAKGLKVDAGLLDRLTDYLAGQIAAADTYQVVPRAQLKQRLTKQRKASYKSCVDQSCQIDIGRELAAQKSLATKIVQLGSRCMVITTLYDLKRAAAERGATTKGGCSEDQLVASLETVVKRLRKKSAATALVRPRVTPGMFVDSIPRGAEVWLDGKKLARKTPMTMGGLKLGKHQLLLKHGLLRFKQTIAVKGNSYLQLKPTLVPLMGRLEVLSDPAGAEVQIDGRVVGRTPWIGLLPPGPVKVEVVTPDGTRQQKQLLLVAGRRDLASFKTGGVASPPKQPEKADTPSGGGYPLWGKLVLGLAAGAAAGAAVLYGVGLSEGNSAYDEYQKSSEVGQIEARRTEVEGAQTKLLIGHILVGVAGASLVAGIVAAFYSGGEESQSKSGKSATRVSLSPTTGGAYFGISGVLP